MTDTLAVPLQHRSESAPAPPRPSTSHYNPSSAPPVPSHSIANHSLTLPPLFNAPHARVWPPLAPSTSYPHPHGAIYSPHGPIHNGRPTADDPVASSHPSPSAQRPSRASTPRMTPAGDGTMVADVDDRKSSTTEEDDDTYVDQAARHLARMREHDATMADAEAGRQTIPAKRPRALKQTRRAEQNRAAQRAFRERKETHLKELEDRSKNFEALQADYIAGEARRNEVELRARALADRAVQMDARERMLDAREAALRSGTTGEAHQSSTSSSTHHSTTTSTPSNTTGGPSDAEGELSKVKEEMQAMRREMKDREAVVLALRRALEEMSTDNGRLRRAYEAAQQELMLRQPLLPLA